MNRSGHLLGITFLLLISYLSTHAQVPKSNFDERTYDATQYSKFKNLKKIPDAIKPQVLVALSFYPELNDTKIIFRHRERRTPLTSRPRLWSTFKKKVNRTYIITISTKSNPKLTPILFSSLPYNAQIGVLGHEFGHITGYQNKDTWQLLGLYLRLLNAKNVNDFEFMTDRTCIEHGLGYQLYDWSQYVRQALDIPEWRGASDANYVKKTSTQELRYMNPETIADFISKNVIYEKVRSVHPK